MKDLPKYRLYPSINDIQTLFPDLMKDWGWEANSKKPFELLTYSRYRAHWLCHVCGHSWVCDLSSRTESFHGCPNCSKTGGSVPERLLLEILRLCLNKDVKYRYRYLVGLELDCFVPSLMLGFEYNGVFITVIRKNQIGRRFKDIKMKE